MDIHDYFAIKNWLEFSRETAREVILHDVLLNPENYPPAVVESLSADHEIRISLTTNREAYRVEMSSQDGSERTLLSVPDNVLSEAKMSRAKEKEIEDYAQFFVFRTVGKMYGLANKREVINAEIQEKFFLEENGKRMYSGMKFDPTGPDDPNGVRFRLEHRKGYLHEDYIFYVSPDVIIDRNLSVYEWRYWDEISETTASP